jgi:hypothetical protein
VPLIQFGLTMMKTELNLQDADGFYEQLLDAHEGLSSEESEQLNMRLILLLANQVGDASILQDCIESASEKDKKAISISS